MNDSNVHFATHPSGHPNKTAVNADNPIFGRPADPVPAVSLGQAALVQSAKHPRETVVSPLTSDLEGDQTFNPLAKSSGIDADAGDWTKTEGAGLTDNTTPASEVGKSDTLPDPEQSTEEAAKDSSPSAEDLDAVAAENAAKEATAGTESEGVITPAAVEVDSRKFAAGQKVRFTTESGNDTEPVYTIDGGELGQGDDAPWFWHLVEMPGLFLGQSLTPAE